MSLKNSYHYLKGAKGCLKIIVHVKSLCTNIRKCEGIKAVWLAYDKNNNYYILNLDFKVEYLYFQL